MEPVEHLFRHEAGRMISALTRVFGIHNLALAEDVVQDALCRAVEVWKFSGVPQNPSAWLMAAAKNRALDVLRREGTARTYAPELGRLLESEWTLAPVVAEALSTQGLKDEQLRMMFSCCHPKLREPAQVALVLNVLCGFGTNEIAAAFLSSEAAIEKRLQRAKHVLAGSRALFDLADVARLAERLPAVHRALYLLFNEGYHGASAQSAVRVELCEEAMRLSAMLVDHPVAGTPTTCALAAMMCLHAARLPARVDASGNLTTLFEQDRTQWDPKLIAEGRRLLERSASGPDLTEYHLEAAIALMHAEAASAEATNWEGIVALYGALMALHPSPVIALNRAIAVAQHQGPTRGLEEIEAITGRERLETYPFYFAAMGDLELRRSNCAVAETHFRAALALARNAMERHFLEGRVSAAASGLVRAQV